MIKRPVILEMSLSVNKRNLWRLENFKIIFLLKIIFIRHTYFVLVPNLFNILTKDAVKSNLFQIKSVDHHITASDHDLTSKCGNSSISWCTKPGIIAVAQLITQLKLDSVLNYQLNNTHRAALPDFCECGIKVARRDNVLKSFWVSCYHCYEVLISWTSFC